MILQALTEYYDRKMDEDDAVLTLPGFERKEIPFVVVLDREGRFVALEDTRQKEGKKLRGRTFTVPQAPKRTVNVAATLLWDKPEYVFGVDTKGKPERAREQHEAFVGAIRALGLERDEGVGAVLAFLERGDFSRVFSDPGWSEAESTGANVSFRLQGEQRLVCQRTAVGEAVAASAADGEGEAGFCLVTGEEGPVARLHPPIKGVWGAQTSGANIVSFNLAAFNSRGRTQGYNAPVGERAAYAYATALNHLLDRDSRQRLQVGDASTVFWAERPHVLETAIPDFFGEPPKDDPDRNTEAVALLYDAPRSGREPVRSDDPTRFYVLGLAPNASRVAVRFWHVGTAGELAQSIRQHFDDLRIVRSPFDPEVLPLFRLLVSTATLGKAENIRPNLAGDFMRSILQDTQYPRELLAAAVQRNRAEQRVTYPRAALVKAWLVREARRLGIPPTSEVGVSLDPDNPDRAYRLGRLFAALERTQEDVSPGINATIRDRYFGAASTTPVTVFPRLLKLNTHHLSKLRGEKPGLAVNREKLIGGVMSGLDDFPSLLSLAEQGRFSIGYYHQRQDFFTKKTDGSDPTPSENGGDR